MSFIDTELALQTGLNNVPSIPSIAWPNIEFNPTIGKPYVVPHLLPAVSELFTISEIHKQKGIFQVDIYVPFSTGIKTLYNIADSIKTYFESHRTLTSNGQKVFVQEVSVSKSDRQDAWYVAFVDINYLSFN